MSIVGLIGIVWFCDVCPLLLAESNQVQMVHTNQVWHAYSSIAMVGMCPQASVV